MIINILKIIILVWLFIIQFVEAESKIKPTNKVQKVLMIVGILIFNVLLSVIVYSWR